MLPCQGRPGLALRRGSLAAGLDTQADGSGVLETMRLEMDPAYVKQELLAPLRLSVFFVILMAACIVATAANAKLSTHFAQLLAVAISSNLFHRMHKTRHEGENSHAVIYTSKDDRLLHVHRMDGVMTIALSEVRQVTLQYRNTKLVAILIKTKLNRNVRIARYQNMPALADRLKSTTKPDNLKIANWFHL